MLGEFAAALSRLNPTSEKQLTGDGPHAGGSAAESDGDPVELFECPSCGTVFIAREKQHCGACGVAVDSVPATY